MAQRRSLIRRAGTLAFIGGVCLLLSGTAAHAQTCVGDCDDMGSVGINELIIGVNIALGLRPVADCPSFACTGGDTVPINCLVQGVNNALGTCGPTPPTPTPGGPTPTATVGGTPSICPLEAGQYTITSGTGGSLRVATLSQFPFPPGGQVVMQVAQGNADCLHEVVIGFPGGFSSPTFCITSITFSRSVSICALP